MKILVRLRVKFLNRILIGIALLLLSTPSAWAWFPGEPTWRGQDKYNEVLAQLQKAIPPSSFDVLTKPQAQKGLRGLFSKKPKNEALNEQAFELQQALFAKPGSTLAQDPRNRYRKFLRAIRNGNEIIQKGGQLNPALNGLFSKVTHALYTQVDLHSFNDRLVCGVAEQGRENIFNSPIPPPSSNHPIFESPSQVNRQGPIPNLPNFDYAQRKVDSLSKIFDRIRANPQIHFFQRWASSLRGEFTYGGLDPNMEANLLSVKNRFLRDDNTEHLALRFPSQTIGSSRRATITPEFKGYLASLEGKKHTYVNLQNIRENAYGKTWAPTIFSDERHRARALHNFSDQQNNLVLITLTKNSAFHSQKGKSVFTKQSYDEPTSFANFKQELLRQLVPGIDDDWKRTGIRLGDLWNPQKWSHEDFDMSQAPSKDSARAAYKARVRDRFSEMIDTLGRSLGFTHRTDLSPSERRGLIELTYDLVSDYASRSSFSSNKSCKDAIDRGGGANALTYFTTSLRQMCEDPRAEANFEKTMDALPGVLFSDALQTRKRAIIHERLESFQEAAGVLIRGLKTKGCAVFSEGCVDGKGNCLRNQYAFNKIAPGRKNIEIPPQDAQLQDKNCKHTETEDPPLVCGGNISFPIQLESAGSFEEIGRAWNIQQGGEGEDDDDAEEVTKLRRY